MKGTGMFKSIVAASVISLAASTSAFAASPAAPGAAAAAIGADRAKANIIEVQHRRSTSQRAKQRPRYQGRYHPGRRYSRAPRGWHRYSARPYNWHTRGCILVGPVWFCP
jgi:hypothetical protein